MLVLLIKLKKDTLDWYFQAKNSKLYYKNLHITIVSIFVNNAKAFISAYSLFWSLLLSIG